MDSAADRQTGGDARDAALIDLSAIAVPDLLDLAGKDSALAQSLRRRLSDDGVGLLTSFGSFVDDE